MQTSFVHVAFTVCIMKPFLQLQGLCKYNFYIRNICGEPIYLHKLVGKRWILHKLHGKRLDRVLAFLPVLVQPLRIFSLGKTKAVILFMEIEESRAVDWARMMQRRGECGSSKLFYSWPTQSMAIRGKCMARRCLLDMECILMMMGLPLGMHKGIDAPLCGRSNQHMDPHTALLYFPNQRLSESSSIFLRA